MVIAIMGRDGVGKSTLADMLSVLFSKDGLTVVVDTDLTQPTLPVRLPSRSFSRDDSLGKAVAGTGTTEVNRYLKQHPQHKALFFAGLVDGDDYLTYELGLEADEASQDFVEQCKQTMDMVILDCSAQRTDPFVPGALASADAIILLMTPDMQGVCWYLAVKPLLERMNVMDRILPVVTMVKNHNTVDDALKTMGIDHKQLAAQLPIALELSSLRNIGSLPDESISFAALRWKKQVRYINDRLIQIRGGK